MWPTAHRAEAWLPFTLAGDAPFDPQAGYQSDIVHAQKEFALLRRFLFALDQAGIGIPEELFIRTAMASVDENDLNSLLSPAVSTLAALAQHHQLPTRLLDWTRVGTHAAYFAAAGAARKARTDSGVMSVWALSVGFVEQIDLIHRGTNLLDHVPHIQKLTAPRAGNANLHAQAGVFTLCWNLAKISPLDEAILVILQALDNHPGYEWKGGPPLCRFDLPWSETPRLLRLLSYEGVDGARMFPGRDGVVRAMKEHALWDQKE